MNIFTERLILRAIEPEDNAMLLQLINDPETESQLGGASFPVSASAQAEWTNSQRGSNHTVRCILALREKPQVGLGTVILSSIDWRNGTAEIHIKLDAPARYKGYGREAVAALTDYAFRQLRLHSLYANILSYNIASQKMFSSCGYQYDGLLRSRVFKNGAYQDLKVYSCVSGELLK